MPHDSTNVPKKMDDNNNNTKTLASIQRAMETSSRDRGHRCGNFHNYYSFHPPENRLRVLTESGILNAIIVQILASSRDVVGSSEHTHSELEPKRRRLHSLETTEILPPSSDSGRNKTMISYCDLGCNEGDLTLSIIGALRRGMDLELDESPTGECSTGQKSKRNNGKLQCLGLDIDPKLISRANEKRKCFVSNYHDNRRSHGIGNSGDCVTKEESKPTSTKDDRVRVDSTFISESSIQVKFEVCNICDANDHIDKSDTFLRGTGIDASKVSVKENHPHAQPLNVSPEISSEIINNECGRMRFNLVTIFSTTMWIHIHAGDDGLAIFLRRACDLTDMLLIEPQPSKCYRSVNTRLRKMNRSEIDISSERLKLRVNIEEEIENIICSCGFRRISINEIMKLKNTPDGKELDKLYIKDNNKIFNGDIEGTSNEEKERKVKTSWNRSLQLYTRRK